MELTMIASSRYTRG